MKRVVSLVLVVVLLTLPLVGCSAFESKEDRILGTWYVNLDRYDFGSFTNFTETLTAPITFYSDGTFSGHLAYRIYSMSDNEYVGGDYEEDGKWEYLEQEDIFKTSTYWGYNMFEIKFSGNSMTVTCLEDDQAFYDEIAYIENLLDITATIYAESVEYKKA